MATVKLLQKVPIRKDGNDFPALQSWQLDQQFNAYRWTRWDGVTIFDVSYIKGGYFELPINLGAVQHVVNYCQLYQDSVTVWAFVDRMEWTSANSTRFYYTIDYFTTYAQYANIGGYRTRRRIDVTQKPTSILSGDFVGNYQAIISKKEYTFDLSDDFYVLVYVMLPAGSGTTDFVVRTASATPNLDIIVLRNFTDIYNFNQYLTSADGEKFANRIVNAYAIPKYPLQIGVSSIDGTDYGALVGADPVKIDTFTLDGNNYGIFDNDNDTHIIISSDGAQTRINPSELSSYSFDVYFSAGTQPALTIKPSWKQPNKSKDIHYSNFPQYPLTVDQYNWWMQRNILGMISGAAGVGISLMTGNVMGAISSGISGFAGVAQQAYNASIQSPFSTAQSSTAMQSVGDAFLSVSLTRWNNATTNGLAYYRREGFPCLDFGTIDLIATYPENAPYDYYKCADITVSGVPAEAQTEIAQLLEKGIRVWNTVQIT